jgi:hypothetical protein
LQTNIIFFQVPGLLAQNLYAVLPNTKFSPQRRRDVSLVTNLDLNDEDTQEVCSLISSLDIED